MFIQRMMLTKKHDNLERGILIVLNSGTVGSSMESRSMNLRTPVHLCGLRSRTDNVCEILGTAAEHAQWGPIRPPKVSSTVNSAIRRNSAALSAAIHVREPLLRLKAPTLGQEEQTTANAHSQRTQALRFLNASKIKQETNNSCCQLDTHCSGGASSSEGILR
uniref:Uncharacterized protein n=1 Tax=Trichuris muris TaxID=70415 RepID=A0A5S6Q7Y3_TRIMR